jgi:collagenase-like PrtC family protease
MAPAGGWPQLKAAVANGADAVYVGLSAFSARARATNFDASQLQEAVQYCHQHDVHLYVALNTLVFQHEFVELVEWIQVCEQVQVDAVIVQDIGLMKLIQAVAPCLKLHASTQQTVSDANGVAFAAQQGATRVVLGRELSLTEIQQIAQQTVDTELEVFVHGALCVSYSGQCFSSEFQGGRSANRGQCAQACRLPYGLVVDGEWHDLVESYLLSPQDLCGLQHIPQLLHSVSCLKIEGRLKDAAYVAATTRAYRQAVDQAWQESMIKDDLTLTYRAPKQLQHADTSVDRTTLVQLFSRGQDGQHDGLTSGFFQGSRHQELVIGKSPRHRGVYIGQVVQCNPKTGVIQVQVDNDASIQLKRGDGIVIDRGLAELEELGGPIYEIGQDAHDALTSYIQFSHKTKVTTELVPPGALIWRTHDAVLEQQMQKLVQAEPPKRTVLLQVQACKDQPLRITVTLPSLDGDEFITAVAESDTVLVPASRTALSKEAIQKAVGTLGNTPFALADHGGMNIELEDDLWCPVSAIKETRRKAIQNLQDELDAKSGATKAKLTSRQQEKSPSSAKQIISQLMDQLKPLATTSIEPQQTMALSVLCRSLEQVDCLCDMIEDDDSAIVDEIIIDFLEVQGMQDAMERIQQVTTRPIRVVLASPRILKPAEDGIWKTLLSLRPDALLVRSPGLLYRMQQLQKAGTVEINGELIPIPPLFGDFSLNVANPLTAFEFLQQGLERITPTYDLNARAISALARTMDTPQQLEVVVHAKLPTFHTEHCVFARFLSKGNSYQDCGHVCTRHSVHLRDGNTGADQLVLADMGCRNTVFSAEAQSGVHSLKEWQQAGVGRVRIELVDECLEDIKKMIAGYEQVLDGTTKPGVIWEMLENVRDTNGRISGVSLGSLRNQVERRAGELK